MMTTTNTTVFKRMGRILSLVFSDYNEARALALFCGLSVLSGFMNNMICIGGCLTMLIFMAIKLAVSLVIGIIALPICTVINIIRITKYGNIMFKVINSENRTD